MTFLTIFPDFEDYHIYKDVGQVNILTSRLLGVKPHILSYNKTLNESFGMVGYNFIKINEIFKRVPHIKLDFNILIFLILNAKKYKYLNLYHPTFATQIYAILYKKINSQGKVYIKLDLDLEYEKNNIEKLNVGVKSWIKRKVFTFYKDISDVVSVESKEAYELLLKNETYNNIQLIKIPNGVSSKNLSQEFGSVNYFQKENIILTVARIGTEQKNNELMLLALEKCNLKDWNYLFVGPIEDKFNENIRVFFERNPHLVGTVRFLGPKNRSEIAELYKKSKAFVLSSNYEGFPLVYAEASFYGCHIITTAVSGSADITNNGNLGDIIPIGNYVSFYKAIQKVVDNDLSYVHFEEIRKHAIDNFTWEQILPCLTKRLKNG